MANLSAAVIAVLDQMSIIDHDYFKKSPKPCDDGDWDDYVQFIKNCELENEHNNFLDALEDELGKLESRQKSRQEIDRYYTNDYYVGSLEPLDSLPTYKSKKKTGDLSFNDICSMEMDSFQYWLKEASIEELEVFGRFTLQDKPRKHKRNIIQLLLGK